MPKEIKNNNMNFGKWIVVAFVLFAMFIGTLVTICVKQDISLVSKSYYKDELGYQDQITRIGNTRMLTDKPKITNSGSSVEVTFEPHLAINKGELKLFCPSNPEMDKAFALSLNSDNSQSFDVNSLKPGMYKAKLLWTMGEKEYFLEQIIYI
jgi:hypothetical protein